MGFEGGSWGIVIVISALMIQVFTFGVTGAIGVYNIEFLEYFQVSASKVSLVAAFNFGGFLGSGPIVSFMMTKFSYRKIALGGSALVVIGLLTVPLFPNLYVMYVTVGLSVGFGSCCAYIPSHTLCGLYFNKYRSLATGVATSGSGLGFAIMPVLSALFIETYAWRGSFIILAGLCLHLFIFSALLRSPPALPVDAVREDNEMLQNGNPTVPKKTSDKLAEQYSKFTSDSFGSVIAIDESKENLHLLNKDGDDLPPLQDAKLQKDPSVTIEQTVLPETARHVYIFKSYHFVVYFINNYFWNASTAMIAAFAPAYFRRQDISILEVSWIMGGFGFGTFIGGIVGGILGNLQRINRTFLFIISCFLLGVSTLLVPVGQGIPYYAFMILLVGLFFGIMLGLLIVVLADLIGIESLSNGMGYLMLSNGIGTFTGPVFAGMLIDAVENYESSFYLSGILSLLSGAAMCLIPFHQHFKSCGNSPVLKEFE